MTDDDDLERCRDELYRRVDAWIETLRDLETAEVARDPEAISAAEEAVYQAGMAIAEPAVGKALRSRMAAAIEPLDNAGDDLAIMQQRALLMHRRFLIDTRCLGIPIVTDTFTAIAESDLDARRG
jgi:hypothetical protein